MSLLRAYTHKYDIRGRISKKFGNNEAYLIGKAFGSIITTSGKKGRTVVIGLDTRDTSVSLASHLTQGFVESGINVIDIGVCTTPMLRFASMVYEVSGSVMITASHNSLEDNGFKFTLNNDLFYGKSLQTLCDVAEKGTFINGTGSVTSEKIRDLYIQNLVRDFTLRENIRSVWIARNRFTETLLEDILSGIPGQHMIKHDLGDFSFFKPHVIFDFDSDVDRMIMYDGQAKQWHGDETLTLFALNMFKTIPDLKVIFDLKSSRVLIGWLESIGVKCTISRIGSCFIDKKMKDLSAHLGGETSGHFMFHDYNNCSDDGIYAALRMLHYLSALSGTLPEIRELFPKVHISRSIKINCGDQNKWDLLNQMKALVSANNLVLSKNEEDAILVQNIEGWYLIRVSETENAISVRCEGFDRDGLETIQSKTEELLSGVGLSLW